MKKSIVYILTLLFCLVACDDNTGTLGGSTIPEQDNISVEKATYHAKSRSIAVDSVLGRTSKVYLGRFTDPDTQTMFEADFIAQFNCVEGGNIFPTKEEIYDEAEKIELRLFFTSYFGDGNNTMTAEVYELQETLQEGEKYYTDIDPKLYCDTEANPLATKVYTAMDHALEDSELEDSEHYHNVIIPLPTEKGTEIIKKYREHPEYFNNASNFINNVCKGYYVKASQGDGTILYVDQVVLNVYFKRKDNDSIYVTQFPGSQEVLQANRFHTDENSLSNLTKDSTCTYIKTPASIFTEVELPIDSIGGDAYINSVQITFDCYNESNPTEYNFGTPQELIMLRKSDMHTFFEGNKLTDNITSYYTNYNATYNNYAFANIANLINYCNAEHKSWMEENKDDYTSEEEMAEAYKAKFPEWNKVVLIPVTSTLDSGKNIVNFNHDFSLNMVRLVGGESPITVKVITSKFN